MATYRMDDNTIVKTENATAYWESKQRYARSPRETLHCSRRKRYWIEHHAEYWHREPRAEWISNYAATQWLLANGHQLPEDLKAWEAEVSE